MSSGTENNIELTVYTYHCICTQLVFSTTTPLGDLSTRSSDKSHICPVPENSKSHCASILNTSCDSKPTVIRREDGFEKKYFHRCIRCDLKVAYQLDKSQYEGETGHGAKQDVVYLLPNGLQSTEDMKHGKTIDLDVGRATARV